MKKIKYILGVLAIINIAKTSNGQAYPDQHQVLSGGNSIIQNIESSNNIKLNNLKNIIELETDALEGSFILNYQSFDESFNIGLPAWNGHAPANQNSSFRVQMRFEMSYGWSSWVTVGFWDKNIWSSYGNTSFSGGEVNIDVVELNSYIKNYQFKVDFKRMSASFESPNIRLLSFFVSDSRTTSSTNITAITNDKPNPYFIPTSFVYQYDVDDEIGPSICSPSSTSMVLKSFGIEIDTYDFAMRTKDPYWGIFGVWPRSTQHASEYGLKAYVSRYRTWSEASEVLVNGGRIAMSIGQPLYSGHLVMLAGFDNSGNPILHDPAKSSGYSIVYNKASISQAWFNKGGVGYTFFNEEETNSILSKQLNKSANVSIYPNPLTENSRIRVNLSEEQNINIKLYNLQSQCVSVILSNRKLLAGQYEFDFPSNLKKGIYIIDLESDNGNSSTKVIK